MNALVRAELLKMRTTRMPAWLLIGTVAMVVVSIAATIPSTESTNATPSLDDPALLARTLGVSFLWPQLTLVVLGVLTYTQEIRYGTISSALLVEPRRRRLLAGKGAALVLASAPFTGVILALTIPTSLTLIGIRHGNATLGAEFWQVAVSAFLVMALSALMGFALGALVRHQIVAVTATLIWLTAGEHLLIEVLPRVARWTPGGATAALLQLGTAATTTGTLLDAPMGGLLLIGYAAAVSGLACIVTPRRDVL